MSRLYPELRERTYGEAEGLDADACVARWGDWPNAEIPGAESRTHLRARGLRALRHVVRDARHATAPAQASVIVVTHGALIGELLRHASGGEHPLPGTRLANGSAHELLYERDRIRLLSAATALA